MAPSRFSLGICAVSLLVTLVMAAGVWESYRPDTGAEALRARRDYYEKVLRQADVSWHEASHYRVVDGTAAGPRP